MNNDFRIEDSPKRNLLDRVIAANREIEALKIKVKSLKAIILLSKKESEVWNQELTKTQALAQERLVGTHHCPEWDEMQLVEGMGMMEFAVCSCKPFLKAYDEDSKIVTELKQKISELETHLSLVSDGWKFKSHLEQAARETIEWYKSEYPILHDSHPVKKLGIALEKITPIVCKSCGSENLTVEKRIDGYTECCDCGFKWRTDGSIF